MKLKRYTGIFIFSLFIFFSSQAQNISAYFAAMPNEILLLLDINKKKDLIDLYRDNKNATVKNALNGNTSLLKMTDNYLLLRSDSSTFEMMLLPLINDSWIICTINTACAPVCDSRIHFYTTEWKVLDAGNFITTANAKWFIKEDASNAGDDVLSALAVLDIDLMEYHFNPEEETIVQTYNTPAYLSKEIYNKVKPYLKEEPKVFRWQKIQFR